MYSSFAAGSTLSVQPGQRASCSTFSACLGAIGVLLRIGGVQLLAWFSTEAAARRLCSVLQTIFDAVNGQRLFRGMDVAPKSLARCGSQRLLALFVSKLRVG